MGVFEKFGRAGVCWGGWTGDRTGSAGCAWFTVPPVPLPYGSVHPHRNHSYITQKPMNRHPQAGNKHALAEMYVKSTIEITTEILFIPTSNKQLQEQVGRGKNKWSTSVDCRSMGINPYIREVSLLISSKDWGRFLALFWTLQQFEVFYLSVSSMSVPQNILSWLAHKIHVDGCQNTKCDHIPVIKIILILHWVKNKV